MRRVFAVLIFALAFGARAADEPLPNIVFIISDDQAWNDYGFMGHPDIRTPQLDKLAKESAVFERGYVPTSLCRTSLASMITGLYPHQHKITGNDPPKGVERDAMLKHIKAVATLPRLLGEKGYVSLQTGKWWEGNCTCGGFTQGMTEGDPLHGGRHGDDGLKIGRDTMEPIYEFVDSAVKEKKPFFVWYAPMLPHQPHNPPERLLAHYEKPGRSIHLAKYYAMCEWFDETCGALLDYLDAKKLAENTIVVYLADNGWIQDEASPKFAPRSKRTPYEGGVRTPIMIRWPGRIPAMRSQAVVSSIDLAPTLLRECGMFATEGMHGIDLIELAQGKSDARGGVFGATFSHDVADIDDPRKGLAHRWTVQGKRKLIWPADANEPAELYQLDSDPWEKKDLARQEPDIVADLKARIDKWWKID